MRSLLRTLGAGILIGAALNSLPVQACRGQVRLNEILADPARDWDGDGTVNLRNDEWVEIVNAGDAVAALDGLYFADAGNIFRFGFSGSLPPGAVLLVTGTQSVAWETSTGASTVGLSLNNTGDTVRLFQVIGADTVVVDEYTYAAHEGLDDRSTGREPDGADTWFIFDALNPYSGTTPPLGTGCQPTPGITNGCPVPVAPSTWGDVKRLYDPEAEASPETPGSMAPEPPPDEPREPDPRREQRTGRGEDVPRADLQTVCVAPVARCMAGWDR